MVDPSDPACSGNMTDFDTASQRMAGFYTDDVVSFETLMGFAYGPRIIFCSFAATPSSGCYTLV
jgi:hypothetical protein